MSRSDALELARRAFLAGERVEMGTLADQHGVNRTTLYRWVGSRDALLAELVWELMERGLQRSERSRRKSAGVDRLAELLVGLFAGSRPDTPVRRFVAAEPAVAMRVMTTGPVHERLIDWFAAVITEETGAGAIAPRYPARQIAELVVKTGEAVFWFDTVSGRGLDIANMRVLLEALCSPADGGLPG